MKNLSFILLLFSIGSFCQSKTITILDSLTKEPIDLVHITYSNSSTGNISNADGIVKINLQKDSIYISHINYKNRVYSSKNLFTKDTLFIHPTLNTLDEIVLYDYDLKNKLKQVLDNYKKYYYNGQLTNTLTYKENFEINDKIVRLFQAQYKWWTRYNFFELNTEVKKQNKLSLEKVDYSKITSSDKDERNGGFLKSIPLIKFSNLNFNLILLAHHTKDVYINSINKNIQTTDINFDADYFEDGKNLFNYKNSIISIDNKTKSIKYILLNMVYKDNKKVSLSRKSKISYTSETTKHKVELFFKKFKNKYSLSYFTSELNGFLTINNEKSKAFSSQKFLITNTEKGKKNKKAKEINLDKALYDYIPLNKNKETEILLTKKEIGFIKE
ncbi:hypothetical protein [Polaribacter sp. SA4-12]|uniref:hypothetical protein n=1 Tax=Polaribacter sp. SA4-12 TaxID=1312072 RepID=UPI000B3CDEC3|nr:hypothetical protein [Polaribacter sp. SA4-12]ARV14660.1 hypothetical protein BTO07_05615 [Polaribacter sp. SA4-12]